MTRGHPRFVRRRVGARTVETAADQSFSWKPASMGSVTPVT